MDIFISRDLDSRFSEREVSAVDEWLRSDKAFHVMRDHDFHWSQMLAGLWGVKLNQDNVRRNMLDAW